jgi:hypothetical protein
MEIRQDRRMKHDHRRPPSADRGKLPRLAGKWRPEQAPVIHNLPGEDPGLVVTGIRQTLAQFQPVNRSSP